MSKRVGAGILLGAVVIIAVPTYGAGLMFAPLALAIVSRRVRELLLVRDPGRVRLAGTAALLAVAGFLFVEVFVVDSGDNAYLILAVLGWFMVPHAALFAGAVLLPAGPWRLRGALVAVSLVWGLLAIGIVALSIAIWVIPGEDYRNNDVLVSHILGLAVMIGLAAWTILAYSRFGTLHAHHDGREVGRVGRPRGQVTGKAEHKPGLR